MKVIEEGTALTYHLQKASPAVVILLVYFQVLCQIRDSCRQESNLNLRRTCVIFVALKFIDKLSASDRKQSCITPPRI